MTACRCHPSHPRPSSSTPVPFIKRINMNYYNSALISSALILSLATLNLYEHGHPSSREWSSWDHTDRHTTCNRLSLHMSPHPLS